MSVKNLGQSNKISLDDLTMASSIAQLLVFFEPRLLASLSHQINCNYS